ncbi:MAG: DUF1513 domain-containing protein, partial [Methylibium sp.]|nr:DUF1513 domain-containing protein [Methylibium sp.]
WRAGGQWAGFTALASACALASGAGGVWAGGAGQALALDRPPRSAALPAVRLDNHWVARADEI